MNELKLIYNYKDITEYRLSFNRLANNVLGIDFEKWYNKGGWNDRYICYSYVDGNEVVANVSINKMDIILEGKSKKALQIGTVMTRPEYQNKGLSTKLMNIVLKEYENDFDFIYLFASKAVLNYYPKFGFKQFAMTQFSIDININKDRLDNIQKLDISNVDHFNTIIRLTAERIPISNVLGVKDDQHLLLFHCLYTYYNDIYYLEDNDAIVIFKQEGNKLLVYDVISKNEISLISIIDKISSKEIEQIYFHFTPDLLGINITCKPLQPIDTLFIKSSSIEITKEFVFPATSRG